MTNVHSRLITHLVGKDPAGVAESVGGLEVAGAEGSDPHTLCR